MKLPFKPADTSNDQWEITRTWYLWLPVGFFVFRYAVSLFTDKYQGLESWFLGELGIVENLTVLLLFLAMLVTLRVLYRYGGDLQGIARLFLWFYSLGCLYFLGEEASWGQHWFGWETGEYFRAINDQQETNLHNTSKLLDRIPKGIVSLGIFVGGIAIPLYLHRKRLKIDVEQPFWWLFPTWVCLPAALFASAATWPSKIEKHTGLSFYFDQAQETKELYIAFFFLLFALSLWLRLRRMREAGQSFRCASWRGGLP